LDAYDLRNSSGSLAIFAAIRRASSLVSNLAADRRPAPLAPPEMRRLRSVLRYVSGLQCAYMPEDPILLRQKAEACRLLAEMEQSAERKALWLKRADHWELLVTKAEKSIED
jgi:hypothetical protein